MNVWGVLCVDTLWGEDNTCSCAVGDSKIQMIKRIVAL